MAATYRKIFPSFWTDSKVDEDFTPEDKFIYLYLLTNPHTNICGCYEIGFKQMSRDTGYNEETIKHLINRMEAIHKVIRYDRSTKEVLILNWGKYNWSSSEDLKTGVRKVAAFIKSDSFRDYVLAILDGESIDPPETLPTPSSDPRGTSVSVSVSVTDSVNKNNINNYYTEAFEEFWSAYPKKVGKKEACKAFKKVKEPLAVLLDAIKEQKLSEQWSKDSGRFIPNPATWLNQGRWEDHLERKEELPF